MKLKKILERLDPNVKVELLVVRGFNFVLESSDWNEIREYEDNSVLEISTADDGVLIVTVNKLRGRTQGSCADRRLDPPAGEIQP